MAASCASRMRRPEISFARRAAMSRSLPSPTATTTSRQATSASPRRVPQSTLRAGTGPSPTHREPAAKHRIPPSFARRAARGRLVVNGRETDPKDVVVGDVLMVARPGTGEVEEPVVRIEQVIHRGAYHPITPSGRYYVRHLRSRSADLCFLGAPLLAT